MSLDFQVCIRVNTLEDSSHQRIMTFLLTWRIVRRDFTKALEDEQDCKLSEAHLQPKDYSAVPPLAQRPLPAVYRLQGVIP